MEGKILVTSESFLASAKGLQFWLWHCDHHQLLLYLGIRIWQFLKKHLCVRSFPMYCQLSHLDCWNALC